MHPRFAEQQVKEAMTDTRVVLISGPRQSGKTTLAEKLAHSDMPFLTLDDDTTLNTARRDPVGFIRGLDRAIIDEVQREPRLLLAIKRSVDKDQRPGRFILTGSANLMTLPHVADSLAGRIAITQLLPLAQSELRGKRGTFLERIFNGKTPLTGVPMIADELIEAVLAGGYPEALRRASWGRRQKWLLDYAKAIIERDVTHIAKVDQLRLMPKLLRLLAEHSAQLVNYSSLGAPLGLSHHTTHKYAGIFEQLFLIRSLQPWYRSEIKKIIKTPKLHFLDSGLLAALRNLSLEKLKTDRAPYGALLETFVLAELLKLASWSDGHFEFFHFRDRNDNEVDIVIEDGDGRVVGIEVKAAATVGWRDFSAMRKLAEVCGDKFALGLILYDHDTVAPFGEKMAAAPVSSLWG